MLRFTVTLVPLMEPHQILAPDGTLKGEPPFGLEEAMRLYGAMVTGRAYDRKSSALQRQGRLATYSPLEGQEASQIGAAAALRSDDWLVATYRDAAAMWMQGCPWVNLVLGRTGDERGGAVPPDVRVLPPSITVGAHMIHAVGLAWAERLHGTDAVAMTLFGDGATSEGDFHEAMNFAGVYTTPTVFVCQNNGYAISLPRERQTASETIAQKADAYGFGGVVVDGNDIMAVFAAAADAVARAREGGGPTLIEAVTYRRGPHTTTDDPGRYRSMSEAEAWEECDPVLRMCRYLRAAGRLSEEEDAAIEAAASAEIEAAVAQAEATPPPGGDDIFAAVFARPGPVLEGQRRRLLEEREAGR